MGEQTGCGPRGEADNLLTRVLDLDEEETLTVLSDVCQALNPPCICNHESARLWRA